MQAPSPNPSHRFRDYPFAVQLAVVLVIAYVALHGLTLGSTFVIPFFLGLLLAFVLSPLAQWLERHRWPPALAAAGGVVVYLLVLTALLGGLGWALSNFSTGGGEQSLQARLDEFQRQAIDWLNQQFGIPRGQIERGIQEQRGKLGQYLTRAVSALGTVFSGLSILFLLVPFYIFTMLYFRQHWLRFWTWALDTGGSDRTTAHQLATRTAGMARGYLLGELMRIGLLCGIYLLGLGLLGVPNFFILGIVCALLCIIPFLGTVLATLLPPVVALVSGESTTLVIGVLAFMLLVQVVEEYVILPRLVGGQVKLNPMVTLMASLLGLLVWGMIGMVLFIPLTGILRILLAHFPRTRPYSFVLSDDASEST